MGQMGDHSEKKEASKEEISKEKVEIETISRTMNKNVHSSCEMKKMSLKC